MYAWSCEEYNIRPDTLSILELSEIVRHSETELIVLKDMNVHHERWKESRVQYNYLLVWELIELIKKWSIKLITS